MELAEAGDNPKALRNIAKKLIAQAESGDMQAIKEFADRLDGKAVQQLDADVNLSIEDMIASLG